MCLQIATALNLELSEHKTALKAGKEERKRLEGVVAELRGELETAAVTGGAASPSSEPHEKAMKEREDTMVETLRAKEEVLERLEVEVADAREQQLRLMEAVASQSVAAKKSEAAVEGLEATIAAQGEELEYLRALEEATQQEQQSSPPAVAAVDLSTALPVRSGSFEYADDDEDDEILHQQAVSKSPLEQAHTTSRSGNGSEKLPKGLAIVCTEFVAEAIGDLGLDIGETIVLLKAPHSKQWWKGYAQADPTRRGIFPRSYVEELPASTVAISTAVSAEMATPDAAPPPAQSPALSVSPAAASTNPFAETADTGDKPPAVAGDVDWAASSGDWLSNMSSQLSAMEASFGEPGDGAALSSPSRVALV